MVVAGVLYVFLAFSTLASRVEIMSRKCEFYSTSGLMGRKFSDFAFVRSCSIVMP